MLFVRFSANLTIFISFYQSYQERFAVAIHLLARDLPGVSSRDDEGHGISNVGSLCHTVE